MLPQELGRWGEKVAAEHLIRRGWTILDRNFRCGHKEIDLVARRDGVVAFVEVKTRTSASFGHPLESITPAKRREILHASQRWISLHSDTVTVYRFDAIAVVRERDGRIHVDQIEDAWRV
jgi:putative endonuclease